MASRRQATLTTVTAGGTVTVNAALGEGAPVHGTVVDPAGTPVPGATVVVSNAGTGDAAGALRIDEAGQRTFAIPVPPRQTVRIGYSMDPFDHWYGGPDVDHATKVCVPHGGTTLTLVVTN